MTPFLIPSIRFGSYIHLLKHLKGELGDVKAKSLVALILASPHDEFVKNNIFPNVPYWHFRSQGHVLFFFVGYPPQFIDPDTNPSVLLLDQFNNREFAEAVGCLEELTGAHYSGEAKIVLTVAHRSATEISLDFEWVLEFDIEDILRAQSVTTVGNLFELIIRIASQHPADDALWVISDDLSATEKNEAVLAVIFRYLPFLKGARELFKAHSRFRVRDRRSTPTKERGLTITVKPMP